jgi:hypothetical protein
VDASARGGRRTGEADLERLAHEYLPIHFGRRHGDPSRPWNRFDIHGDGSAGNRCSDSRQLARHLPELGGAGTQLSCLLPNLVAVVLNASTVDGFNPYRLTRAAWSGRPICRSPLEQLRLLGDHQIVYLLGSSRRSTCVARNARSDAAPAHLQLCDVPYRIAPFAEILETSARHPHDRLGPPRASTSG